MGYYGLTLVTVDFNSEFLKVNDFKEVKMFFSKLKIISIVALLTVALASCAINPVTGESEMSNATSGGLTWGLGGATAGGSVGALIGLISGNPGTGAAIGAGFGAAIGGAYGAYQGNTVDEAEAYLSAKLENTGVRLLRNPPNSNTLYLILPGDITFASDSVSINQSFEEVLQSIAIVASRYPGVIEIAGHTDSDGSYEYNRQLSFIRSNVVARYLLQYGVPQERLRIDGYGEHRPIASNATSEGKSANRRVEIKMISND